MMGFDQKLGAFAAYLRQEERAPGTVDVYLCDAVRFSAWLGQRELNRDEYQRLLDTAFCRVSRDIVKLADVLGHSSINTTRIYLMTTGAGHAKRLEKLKLVT